MIGLGTIINVAAIISGGVLGGLFGKFITEKIRDTLNKACGVSVLFIGIAGALEGLLRVEGGSILSGRSMLVVICLVVGGLLGELADFDGKTEAFGEFLKRKTGNSGEKTFVEGFVTASLTVSVGAMAIVGAIEDGISGDYSILATKSVLDLIIILVMTCSMGKGCAFSAIPVFLLQGSVTLLAGLFKSIMTQAALSNLSLIGSILIFCVGVNLVWGKKIRVANLLPSVLIAVGLAFIPGVEL